MSSKKRASKKSKSSTARRRRKRGTVTIDAENIGLMLANGEEDSNGHRHKQPYRINPESEEEREKRLAARKALTLKAASIAYENHHRRKAS